MTNKITGFDELRAKFQKLQDIESIGFEELFPDDFIQRHTNSKNLKDFFTQSGFTINSKEDFVAIPDNDWEKYITTNTHFKSWIEMQQTAHESWLKKWLKDNGLSES